MAPTATATDRTNEKKVSLKSILGLGTRNQKEKLDARGHTNVKKVNAAFTRGVEERKMSLSP